MIVKLLTRPTLTEDFKHLIEEYEATAAQATALTAIRTCYSPNRTSEIIEREGAKYFKKQETDGQGGSEADRLIRHIVTSGHTSTLEHIHFVFVLEGVSRSLLAQLTRHRHLSFSVQSQRYVKFGSSDKSGGFDYVWPETIADQPQEVWDVYSDFMKEVQNIYDSLRKLGVPAEDARMVLPNAATCNLVMSGNLRSLLDFYSKRGEGTHAQHEIKQLAEEIKREGVAVEGWTKNLFKW